MAAVDQSIALAANTQLENYTIMYPLSVGGFGVVYLAKDCKTNDLVAIKEYFPSALCKRVEGSNDVTVQTELDADLFTAGLRCFFEEARLLSNINHPNVVNVSNFFRANQTVYMIMDYYEGNGLDKYLANMTGLMPEKRLRTLFAYIASGLREVHLKHMLHLDIKPANIYLPQATAPIILDFGAARQSVQVDGRQLVGMYTPGYAAPEQYRSDWPQGPWTDVYALAATMYACMGRGVPYPADKRLQQDHLVPAIKRFSGKYSNELLQLIDSCMILDLSKRQSSMSVVQKALLTRPAQWGTASETIDMDKKEGFFSGVKKLFGGGE
ncbi:serine/threonine protein kinase [Neisseria sp. Ec49-e6-T10]|uniref:serine/threonine protein kinase n=1 Tax=Neisseria sp. Ec49-e6-T10 TaxID=3140744 RepID=UPI003EBEC553